MAKEKKANTLSKKEQIKAREAKKDAAKKETVKETVKKDNKKILFLVTLNNGAYKISRKEIYTVIDENKIIEDFDNWLNECIKETFKTTGRNAFIENANIIK